MKKTRLFPPLLMLLAILAMPACADAQEGTKEYIRLHIIANSDSLTDQCIKLCVRDGIREYTSKLLASCADADEAWLVLSAHREEMLCIAREILAQCGRESTVELKMGVFPFPERSYGEEVVPEGDYRALRFEIGEAEGKNWWCVVYPSLCLSEDADTDRPIEFYSSVWRWALRMWEVIAS